MSDEVGEIGSAKQSVPRPLSNLNDKSSGELGLANPTIDQHNFEIVQNTQRQIHRDLQALWDHPGSEEILIVQNSRPIELDST